MTTIKTSNMEEALTRKGFVKVPTHHDRFIYYANGKKTSVHTKISHSSGEYGDSLLSKVAQQMRLSKKQLQEFFDCSLTKESYESHLVTNGHIRLSTNP